MYFGAATVLIRRIGNQEKEVQLYLKALAILNQLEDNLQR